VDRNDVHDDVDRNDAHHHNTKVLINKLPMDAASKLVDQLTSLAKDMAITMGNTVVEAAI